MWRSHRAPALVFLVGVCAVGANACDKTPAPTPQNPYTVTITATGLTPGSLDVPLGSRVLFINNDTRQHYFHSDPHPDATDCTALNQIAVLAPGQRRETANLVELRTCGYHDHDDPTNATYQGRINVK